MGLHPVEQAFWAVLAALAVVLLLWMRAVNRAEAERVESEEFRRYGDPDAPNIHLADGPWWCLFAPADRTTAELDAALSDRHLCRRCRSFVVTELDERDKEGQR